MENNPQSFWHFSDHLRLHNDSIWTNSSGSTRPLIEPKSFDVRVGSGLNSKQPSSNFNDGWNSFKFPNGSDLQSKNPKQIGSGNIHDLGWNSFKPKASEYNGFNDGWKNEGGVVGSLKKEVVGINGGSFSKGLNYKLGKPANNGYKNGGKGEEARKNEGKTASEKRFKTLPATESLPRNESIGGYIFVCNNDTMQENLRRQLFGLPPRYRDSVRAITPGLPLFLYNYSTHQLHGIFEAASFGGSNIDPTAWEDKKCRGESRFPAQVRVITRKICEPLEEDSFRPILHHYDGPKFRLELSIPEAISLLDILEDQNP